MQEEVEQKTIALSVRTLQSFRIINGDMSFKILHKGRLL